MSIGIVQIPPKIVQCKFYVRKYAKSDWKCAIPPLPLPQALYPLIAPRTALRIGEGATKM